MSSSHHRLFKYGFFIILTQRRSLVKGDFKRQPLPRSGAQNEPPLYVALFQRIWYNPCAKYKNCADSVCSFCGPGEFFLPRSPAVLEACQNTPTANLFPPLIVPFLRAAARLRKFSLIGGKFLAAMHFICVQTRLNALPEHRNGGCQ